MASNKPASVQELRAVFANSQLSGGSALESQSSTDNTTENSNETPNEDALQKNQAVRHSLKKPTIGPKPNSIKGDKMSVSTSKPGIKNLVAALEGSHGMYTQKNMPRKHGLTVKDVQNNLENHPQSNIVTSKIAKDVQENLENNSPSNIVTSKIVKDVQENLENNPPCNIVTSKLVKKETITLSMKPRSDSDAVLDSSVLNNKPSTQEIAVLEPKTFAEQEIQSDSMSKTYILNPDQQTQPTVNELMSKTYIVRPDRLDLSDSLQSRPVVRESVISPDNYVYKQGVSLKRRPVPSRDELGPPPAKPPRVPEMRLPLLETNHNSASSVHSSSGDSLPPPVPNRNPNMMERPPVPIPAKPSRALPKAPSPTSPSPPLTQAVFEEEEEAEEIYNDVIFNQDSPGSKSDEEEDIYDDHTPQAFPPSLPRYPPPPPPSTDHLPQGYLNRNLPETDATLSGSTVATGPSSLNNDSSENDDTDGIYEEAQAGPEYMNTEEVSQDKTKKRKKKPSLKTEQKTLEKIEKKREKFMKKFMLSGEEIPLDAGTVKNDSKGNKFDLNVTKGETVLILRMENNPSGKWLAKNGNGRVGYVELTNIRVDVESVKSVMTARTSQIFPDVFSANSPPPD